MLGSRHLQLAVANHGRITRLAQAPHTGIQLTKIPSLPTHSKSGMDATTILIVYATVGGNTELVVQQIAEIFQQSNLSVRLARVESTNSLDIVRYRHVILASPTYFHGQLEPHFEPFLQELSKLDLTSNKFAVIGLGDKRYYPEYLCEAAKILEDFLTKHQGQTFAPSLRIATTPALVLQTTVRNWAQRVAQTLTSQT